MALVFGFFGWNFACLSQFLSKNLAYLTLISYLRENELGKLGCIQYRGNITPTFDKIPLD